MKLLEYEAKEYFRKYGIPTPEGVMVTDSDTAVEAAKKLGKPVVIKAQLPVGGRGKAGGIKFAENPLEAGEVAAELLGKEIKGLKVEKLYVEEKLDIKDELYLGITVDRNNNRYVVLASKEGGVEIEEVASKTPEKIIRHQIDPIMGLRSFHANHIGQELGYSSKMMRAFASFVTKLYTLAREMDAELTEINPLIELEDGFLAADARLNVDNNALFRHKELEEKLLESYQGELTERELDARKKGLTYVELDGNIGIIGNGAGLTMATLDTVMLKGGKAANFLDLGGGATPERIEEAAKFILSDERTEALLINVLGGITRCDHIAEGLVNARTEVAVEKPIVVRMMGTKEEEGREILRNAGIDMLDTMETASEKAVQIVEEN
ncbi:ADP-forming succinate--CoA ligase subunit beta [Candidatus Bathyarchaeota archaeon]|nr:ADP-forming succinate--CoA ligase subunit beta [Candidatus Bathyarchaeota archaeon]